MDVTGDVTLKGTLSALPARYNGVDYTSCADYGEPDDNEPYFVRARDLKGDVDSNQILVRAEIEDYQGRTPTPIDQMNGSDARVDLNGKLYFIGSGATSTSTIDANGGGIGVHQLVLAEQPNRSSSGKLCYSITRPCDG